MPKNWCASSTSIYILVSWEQPIVFQVVPPPACGEAAKPNISFVYILYCGERTGAAVFRINPVRPQYQFVHWRR